MPWTYHQRTGNLYHNGQFVATGYSGHGAGKNKPDMEDRRGRLKAGPIPRGYYRIGPPHHGIHTGPHVMDLTPIGHTAHGRTAFQMHGDSSVHVGRASVGCIILKLVFRQRVADSGDDLLRVER